MYLFRREIELLGEDRINVLVDDKLEFFRNVVIFILVLHELLDDLDGDEALIPGGVNALRVQHRGANDGGEVGDVHLGPRLLVAVRE